MGLLAICLQYPIVFLVIILALGSIAGLLYSFGNFFTLSDSLGNTPQDIVEAYTIAWWLEDGDALYRLSCPELYPDVDQMVGDFWGGDYSNSKVDTSQTEFDLYYYSGDQAYITIKGLMSFIDGSETYTVNWDEDAQLNGYDFYGEHVYRTNGVWQVCISRYVPNLEEDE